MGDAIGRTLWRLFITRRHLLQWVPAAQVRSRRRVDRQGLYRWMAGAPVVAGLALIVALVSRSDTWPLALPLAALWFASPEIARRVSSPPPMRIVSA